MKRLFPETPINHIQQWCLVHAENYKIIVTGDPTPVQKPLRPFDDQRRRRERDSQEENDPAQRTTNISFKTNRLTNHKNTHVKMTPGATKSVKLGSLLPYIGSLNWIGMSASFGF